MPRKVNTDQIDQVDEILKMEDPEFVKELEEIKGDELKLAELEAAFAEAEKSNTVFHRFWNDATPLVRWGVVSLAAILLSLPAGYLVWLKFFKPPPVGQMASLERIADAVYDFDYQAPPKNLFDAFIEDEFLFEIPDHVFYMREKRDIRMARVGMYLELTSKEDLAKAEERRDEIIEILNEVFAKSDLDSFAGVVGKAEMKRRMIIALNQKIPLKFKTIRFRLMVFN